MWKEGTIACPETNTAYKYWVKHYGSGSVDYGIDDGRISKLTIRESGKTTDLCNYDRGWDIKPADEIQTVYAILLQKYN